MLIIFCGYIVYLVLLFGFGSAGMLLLNRIGGGENQLRKESIFDVLWTGLVLLLPLVELISIIAPLNTVAALCFLVVSCAFVIFLRNSPLSVKHYLRITGPEGKKTFLFIILGLTLAFLSVRKSNRPDLFFYYLDVIDFANRFPAIPGLVNLNPSLAYNNTFHLFTALLDFGPWEHRSVYLTLGVMYWLALGQFLPAAWGVIKKAITSEALFSFFMLPFLLYGIINGAISSAGTSELTWILTAVVVKYLLALEKEEKENDRYFSALPSAEGSRILLLAFIISLTALVNKLSALPLFAVMAGVSMLFLRDTLKLKEGRRMILAALAFAAVILAVHIGRNAVLSGWIWYPSPVGSFGFDWSFPADSMIGGIAAKQAEARMMGSWWAYDASKGFTAWLFPLLRWMRTEKGFHLLYVILTLFALATVMRFALKKKGPSPSWIAALLACVAGILFVGSQNPYLDYAYGYIWCLFALAAARFFFLLHGCTGRILYRRLLIVTLAAVFSWYYMYKVQWHVWHFGSTMTVKKLLTVEAQGAGTNRIDFTKGRWRIKELPIRYTFPAPGKGNPWYPRENTFLEMRKPGDLSKGFRLSFGEKE